MDLLKEYLWQEINVMFKTIAIRICNNNSDLLFDIFNASNAMFFVSGCLSFFTDPQGDEIMVVSVDSQIKGDCFFIKCDFCLGTGEIIEEGPVAFFLLSDFNCFESNIKPWIFEFSGFLDKIEPKMLLVGGCKVR